MESSSQFASVPITTPREFSWVFFVDWFLTFALAIVMIFYFPRFCGTLVSWFLRITIGRNSDLRIDIHSVKFSFLGGRISFRNLTLIDNDQTISVLQGSLTWRYWLPNCRRRNINVHKDETIDVGVNSKLPCRYLLEAEGFEYFIYNRTVSYDNILKSLNQKFPKDANGDKKEAYDVFSTTASDNTSSPEIQQEGLKPSLLSLFFPLHVKVTKGALVMGNKTTHAVVIASFNSLDGSVDLGKALNPYDGFSEIHSVDIDRLQVSLKPNILNEMETNISSKTKRRLKRWQIVRKFLYRVGILKKQSTAAQTEVWKGLAQYLGDDSDTIPDMIENEEFDYAKYTTILIAESFNICYIYDFPGLVPTNPQPTSPFEGPDVGNGGSSPRYDLNIQLSGATIHYGPWADRQRHTLHQMLSPTLCRDAVPEQKVTPGQRRIFTNFTINIEIVDNLIVRVPTREVSKDEDFKIHESNFPNTTRAFGWIELKINKESNISLNTSLVASKAGYENRLDMTLYDLEARSSVNHDIFMKCKEHSFSSDIGYPLSWNGHTTWTLFNRSSDVETFLLREHITLVSDLFSDFGSGDPTPYELFRPFSYVFDWKIDGYKLFFNINDANIVNNPLDFNDNIYFSLQGDSMQIDVNVPLDSIIRKSTTIDYNIETPGFSFVLDTPPWHTLNNFLKSKEVGRSKGFSVSGSYTYYSEVGVDSIDTVIISCEGEHLALECYGFVVKYIMSIKENYFGDFTRFKTLEEYITSSDKPQAEDNDSPQKSVGTVHKRTENETDVHFSFCLKDSCAIFPCHIYDANSNISIPFEYLDIDIRFTNYYMDMQVDSSTLRGYYFPDCDPSKLLNPNTFQFKDDHDLLIDMLTIHGHRMFGLPPDEPTCFCKWDILPGDIIFNGPIEVAHGLANAIVKLAFGYSNLENKLDLEEPELWDTTNVNIFIPKLDFTFEEPDLNHQIKILATSFGLKFMDITNLRFTNKISIDLEEISASVVHTKSGVILLDFKTSLKLTDFCLKKNYQDVKRKQDEHIIVHDGPFHRLPFFVDNELKVPYNQLNGSIIPGFSVPKGDPTLTNETVDALFTEMGISTAYYDDFIDIDDQSSLFSVNNKDDVESPAYSKTYRDTISGIHEKPSIDYDIEEYTPVYKGDPDFETDSIVLNFGNIDLNLCLESLIVILNYIDKAFERTLDLALDTLQVAVLKKLRKKFATDSSCINIRFVTSIINLNLARESWSPSTTNFDQIDNVNCSLESPSLVFSLKETTVDKDEISLAFHLASLGISFKESSKDVNALNIILDDLETWTSKKKDLSFSFNLKNIETSFHTPSLDWLLLFINTIMDYSDQYEQLLERIMTKTKGTEIELVYKVALASSKYHIEHDPAVITRPAYVIRLSKKHIRAYDSWNVIVRLRHIFNNLPEEWLSSEELSCSNISTESAMNEVLNVFRQWRSWEFADISDSFIFKYVFSHKTQDVSEDFNTTADIVVSNFVISSFSNTDQRSFIRVTDFGATTSKEIEDQLEVSGEILKTLAVQIGSIDADFSPLLLNLELLQALNLNTLQKSPKVSNQKKRTRNLLDHILVLVDHVDFNIRLNHTSFKLELDNLTSSVVLKNESNLNTEVSLYNLLESIEIGIYGGDEAILSYGIKNIGMVGTYSSDFSNNVNILDSSSKTAFFNINGSHDKLNGFFAGLEKDIISIKNILPVSNKMDVSDISVVDNTENNFKLKIFNENFEWGLSLLDPFAVNGISKQFEASVIWNKGEISFVLEVLHSGLAVETVERKSPLVRNSATKLSFAATYLIKENTVTVSLGAGDIAFVLSDAPFNSDLIYSNLNQAQQNGQSLFRSMEKISKLFDASPKNSKPKGNKKDLVVKEILINNNTLGLGMQFGDSIFSIDLSELSLQYFNLVLGSSKNNSWPYGEMTVKSTKLNLKSKDININHSTMVDFSFGMKIINALESENQTLEIESTYTRVMFTPRTFAKTVGLLKGLNYVGDKLKELFATSLKSAPETPRKSTSEVWKELGLSSIHILSYNFCVGFIFGDSTRSSPGLITGCEKVFAVTEGALGKLSIIGGYFSLAHGDKTDSFFSVGNEVSRPNRAFLPNVQVTYSIVHQQNKEDILINVSGEQLDVKFITSSIVFVEQLISSMAVTEDLIKNQIESKQKPKTSTATENYDLASGFMSVKCTMSFAGAIVKMTRWEDFNENDLYTPSFELKAPAVKIITEYIKKKGVKAHFVKFEVFTYSSNNVLHSTCVPVLYDVWKTMNYLGKESQRRTSLVTPTTEEVKKSTSLKDLLKIFHKVQIQFVLHIDKQELTLSCEPSAKVQAVVGIESIDIHLGSGQKTDDYPLSGTVSIGAVGASLQHSFSREISASFMIDEILITAMLTGVDSFKLYTSAGFGKVKSYLYLKQLQDVDLFMDLWKVSDYGVSSESVKSFTISHDEENQEGIVLKKFQRVSNAAMIPWDMYFVVEDLDFEVDLGQALGVLTLNFDKINITFRKQSDRKQELLLFFNTVALTSKGRLGGHLIVRDIQTRTLINWSIFGDTYDIPIVLLSFGFSCIEIKASFDYNVFLIGKIQKTFISIFNQVDENKVLQDRLVATTECGSIELYITSFAASNIMDIYNTLARIRQDNKTSYKQNLQYAGKIGDGESYMNDNDIIDVLAKLRTELNVKLGKFLIHIYPGSLLDAQVLVINVGGVEANFEQRTIKEKNKMKTDLKLLLNDINISLSSFKSQLPEDSIISLSIDDFIKNSTNAYGGGIFTFPALNCSMTTFIKPKSTLVEYVYKSSFGGKVDIRWNLGSINFIREMWMIHVKALSSRLSNDSNKGFTDPYDEKIPLFMDEKFDKKIKDVTLGDKYQYIPLEKPIIELPQLKELGDATPPLEWFGLNRQNFPGLTHQFVIFSLQKLVQEVETQYAWVLGKA